MDHICSWMGEHKPIRTQGLKQHGNMFSKENYCNGGCWNDFYLIEFALCKTELSIKTTWLLEVFRFLLLEQCQVSNLSVFFGMWRLPGLRASRQDISWWRNANRWRSALQHLWSILFGYHEVPQKNLPFGPQFPSKVHLDPCCIQATGALKMRARSGAFPKIDGFWKIAGFR